MESTNDAFDETLRVHPSKGLSALFFGIAERKVVNWIKGDELKSIKLCIVLELV